MGHRWQIGGTTLIMTLLWSIFCYMNPALASNKSFRKFKFCAVLTANKTVSLDRTSSCTLNGGIPDEVLCARKCNREPQCMHFNYRKNSSNLWYVLHGSNMFRPWTSTAYISRLICVYSYNCCLKHCSMYICYLKQLIEVTRPLKPVWDNKSWISWFKMI